MPIVVDTNAGEDALYKALSSALGDTAVVRRRLDVGDVLLQHAAPEGERAVTIERKTWLDLHKSLIDGRYAEQKARLLAADGTQSTIVYVIEGSLRGWWGTASPHSSIPNSRLEAALLKTEMRDGIHVLRSKDTDHTAQLILYIHKEQQAGTLFTPPKSHEYAECISLSKRKRDNMDPATTWQVMLTAVPGMSANKAKAVVFLYPSMSALTSANAQQLANVLVPSPDLQKKPRRLGSQVADRIVALV